MQASGPKFFLRRHLKGAETMGWLTYFNQLLLYVSIKWKTAVFFKSLVRIKVIYFIYVINVTSTNDNFYHNIAIVVHHFWQLTKFTFRRNSYCLILSSEHKILQVFIGKKWSFNFFLFQSSHSSIVCIILIIIL